MTGRSKVPDAALGVRSHSGWAAYVLLSGNPKQPDIMARGRMQLCDPGIPGSKQPFHEAEPMAFSQAEKFIARCTASSANLADKALAEIAPQARVTACCNRAGAAPSSAPCAPSLPALRLLGAVPGLPAAFSPPPHHLEPDLLVRVLRLRQIQLWKIIRRR